MDYLDLAAKFGPTAAVVVLTGFALYRLAVEFAKLRTDLQQQVARDLLNKRFDAYSELWVVLQPLAIYSEQPLSAAKTSELAEALSKWYFSKSGGMFLTAKARDFYFALQATLKAASKLKTWTCSERPEPEEAKKIFRAFLSDAVTDWSNTEPKDLIKNTDLKPEDSKFNPKDLDNPERLDSGQWLRVCRTAARRLTSQANSDANALNDLVFATVQQVSSALRTILSDELQTRLDMDIPHL